MSYLHENYEQKMQEMQSSHLPCTSGSIRDLRYLYWKALLVGISGYSIVLKPLYIALIYFADIIELVEDHRNPL
jgi:hypothetical protein